MLSDKVPNRLNKSYAYLYYVGKYNTFFLKYKNQETKGRPAEFFSGNIKILISRPVFHQVVGLPRLHCPISIVVRCPLSGLNFDYQFIDKGMMRLLYRGRSISFMYTAGLKTLRIKCQSDLIIQLFYM